MEAREATEKHLEKVAHGIWEEKWPASKEVEVLTELLLLREKEGYERGVEKGYKDGTIALEVTEQLAEQRGNSLDACSKKLYELERSVLDLSHPNFKLVFNQAVDACEKVAQNYELSSKAEAALCCNQDAVLQGKKPYVGSQEINGVDWASAEIAEQIKELRRP